jgi:hypothetical protein
VAFYEIDTHVESTFQESAADEFCCMANCYFEVDCLIFFGGILTTFCRLIDDNEICEVILVKYVFWGRAKNSAQRQIVAIR